MYVNTEKESVKKIRLFGISPPLCLNSPPSTVKRGKGSTEVKLMSFLSIILKVLRLEVSVYIKNQFQTLLLGGGGGGGGSKIC